jgi:hypothetical protein
VIRWPFLQGQLFLLLKYLVRRLGTPYSFSGDPGPDIALSVSREKLAPTASIIGYVGSGVEGESPEVEEQGKDDRELYLGLAMQSANEVEVFTGNIYMTWGWLMYAYLREELLSSACGGSGMEKAMKGTGKVVQGWVRTTSLLSHPFCLKKNKVWGFVVATLVSFASLWSSAVGICILACFMQRGLK